MIKGNTLSTVLLVIVVFFVFYYLTKPKSDRECFSERRADCSRLSPNKVYCCDNCEISALRNIYTNACYAINVECKNYNTNQSHVHNKKIK